MGRYIRIRGKGFIQAIKKGYLELPKSPNFTEITVFLPKSPSDLLKFLTEGKI
jgi:hypothetical protein